MSSIRWELNLAGSSAIGSDLHRLGEYYFELALLGISDGQLLTLWVTGPNPPLLAWRLRQGATEFAETAADVIHRYGLQAAITERRFPLPPDLD
jgi:hypothetical protein